jgi:hypothetical protein
VNVGSRSAYMVPYSRMARSTWLVLSRLRARFWNAGAINLHGSFVLVGALVGLGSFNGLGCSRR